jgi:hypothetical protein
MKTYIRRLLSYLLLSLGIALLAGPYYNVPFSDRETTKVSDFCVKYPASCELSEVEKRSKAFFKNDIFTIMKYAISLLLIGFGSVLFRKIYLDKHSGIMLTPQWASILNDTLSMLFLTLAAYCIWAWGFHLLFNVESYLCKDEVVMTASSIFYIVLLLVLAFFVSNLTSQSIEISGSGLILHYPEQDITLQWKDITGFKVYDTFTVTGGEGWAAPRQLQSKLSIQIENDSFGLYEPGLKRTKKQIIQSLRENAPERLQKDISILEKEW